MAWTWYSGKACLLSGGTGDYISQNISMTIGQQYLIFFTVSGMTQGRLSVGNFEETQIIETNGSYAVLGTATGSNIIFAGLYDDGGNLFDGCIDSVYAFAFTELTGDEIACSPCINVQSDQDECLLLITAVDEGNNLNFDWSSLTLKARIKAKFAKVEYDDNTESLDDNSGDRIVTYFDGKKSRNLLVEAAPVFIHDFLFLCRGVETLTINGTEYKIIDDRYPAIEWNKQFKEGTVELKVRKANYKLTKTNC